MVDSSERELQSREAQRAVITTPRLALAHRPCIGDGPGGDYLACRDLPDGRYLCVMPLTYGRARLVISLGGSHEGGYEDGW